MLGYNVDPAVLAAWLEDMFLPPEVLEWALNTVVVRSGGRTILVDAGIGGEFPDLPRAGLWAQRLEAAGIDLASVTDAVFTHLHMDPRAEEICSMERKGRPGFGRARQDKAGVPTIRPGAGGRGPA